MTSRIFGRKAIALVLVVLSLGTVAYFGPGVWASFTAETDNQASVVNSASLVLSNTKLAGTTCYSTGGGATDTNLNTGCDQLINLTAAVPGATSTANVTLKNEGTATPTSFVLFSPTCTDANSGATTYHGTGSLCGIVQYYVQRFSDAAFTTKSTCVYGGGTASTCAFDSSHTMGGFATSYPSSASSLTLTGGLAPGTSGYFQIGVLFPTTAGNSYQGRQASMTQNWVLQ